MNSTPKSKPTRTPSPLRRQALIATAAIFVGILVSFLAAHVVQNRLRGCIERATRVDPRRPVEAGQIAWQAAHCARLVQQLGDVPHPGLASSLPMEALAELQSAIDEFARGAASEAERELVGQWQAGARECQEWLDELTAGSGSGPWVEEHRSADAVNGCAGRLLEIARSARNWRDEEIRSADENRRELEATMGRVSWLIDLRGIAPLGVVGLWSVWFFYHSLRRVVVFAHVVRLFAEGRLDARVPIEGDDELAQVASQFNEMAAAVEASHHKIEDEVQQHRRTALRLQEASEAAQAANRAKSEFLANMSHELRTPLTAILGFTDVLVEHLEKPANLEAAQTIKRNGEYLLEIINDILDLSKVEAGRLQIERVVCSPMDIIADVASLMRVRADAKKLPLQVKYQGAIPKQIETDPTRLRQILINLVGNAIKFTHQGWVRIVVERLPSVADQTVLAFDVIDTGIGMSEAEIGKLFRPFTQADSSTTRNFGGTGLGLTISKRLAELLGGTVTVASAPGQGSTFRVTIRCGQVSDEVVEHPHEIAAEPASEPARSEAESSGMRARVLLAEDGPDNRRLISFLLTQAGADVETAENGQEAMEKALAGFPGWGRRRSDVRKSFDVILMDMQMPVIDGYEATQRLRAEGYRGPIIALTAHAMNHDRQKCLDAGCDDYLTKPIDKKRLLDIVSRFVAARASVTTEEAPGAVEAAID